MLFNPGLWPKFRNRYAKSGHLQSGFQPLQAARTLFEAKIAQERSGFQLVSGFQEALKLADPGWVTHFAQRLRFNLPDAFPGDAE